MSACNNWTKGEVGEPSRWVVGNRLIGNPAKRGRQKAKSNSKQEVVNRQKQVSKAGKLPLGWHDRQSTNEVNEGMRNRWVGGQGRVRVMEGKYVTWRKANRNRLWGGFIHSHFTKEWHIFTQQCLNDISRQKYEKSAQRETAERIILSGVYKVTVVSSDVCHIDTTPPMKSHLHLLWPVGGLHVSWIKQSSQWKSVLYGGASSGTTQEQLSEWW